MGDSMAEQTYQAWETLIRWCGWALYQKPDEAALQAMVAQRAIFADEPFCTVAPQAARELAAVLDEAAASAEGVSALVRAVELDHTYLFRMVGASHTSPYESVYRTDEAILFGPTTLEVRRIFAEHGMQVAGQAGNEPEDHLGVELQFVAALLAEGNVEAASSFLAEHVLVFAPVYLENVRTQARSAYYRAVAHIVLDAVTALADALDVRASETIDTARYLIAH